MAMMSGRRIMANSSWFAKRWGTLLSMDGATALLIRFYTRFPSSDTGKDPPSRSVKVRVILDAGLGHFL